MKRDALLRRSVVRNLRRSVVRNPFFAAAWFLWCALLVVATASSAGAQPNPSSDLAEAQRLFEQANEAADRLEFGDARRLFERSQALAPRAATALNLALVLRSLGALVESERYASDVQTGRFGEPTPALAEAATALLLEVRARIATLEITVLGADRASVQVDGQNAVAVDVDEPMIARVDPGAHRVVVRTATGQSIEREVMLDPGAREPLVFHFDPVGGEIIDPPPPDFEWLAWTAATLALVGAAIGIVVGVELAPPSVERVEDPVWGAAVLRFE